VKQPENGEWRDLNGEWRFFDFVLDFSEIL